MQLKTAAAAAVLLIIAVVVMVALGYLPGPLTVLLIMVFAIAVIWPLILLLAMAGIYRRQDRDQHF